MKSLGHLIANCLRHGFEPHFSVVEVEDNSSGPQIVGFNKQIEDMKKLKYFEGIPIRILNAKEVSTTMINLHLQHTSYESHPASVDPALPISGFPRELMRAERTFQGKKSNLRAFNANDKPELLLTSHPLASHIATPISSPPGGEVGLINAHTSIVKTSETPKQYG